MSRNSRIGRVEGLDSDEVLAEGLDEGEVQAGEGSMLKTPSMRFRTPGETPPRGPNSTCPQLQILQKDGAGEPEQLALSILCGKM